MVLGQHALILISLLPYLPFSTLPALGNHLLFFPTLGSEYPNSRLGNHPKLPLINTMVTPKHGQPSVGRASMSARNFALNLTLPHLPAPPPPSSSSQHRVLLILPSLKSQFRCDISDEHREPKDNKTDQGNRQANDDLQPLVKPINVGRIIKEGLMVVGEDTYKSSHPRNQNGLSDLLRFRRCWIDKDGEIGGCRFQRRTGWMDGRNRRH
ncbi:Lysophospholipid acyltransferase LPEAT2 [Senna tora]|uniref:Lysophospholipid acyltransferase LPEAT2 n=1 Tax=Senna tora TaxID=362788 RepID=A0A834TLX5_9FABA|nr:Lysophospholipid acyltransferase LPEAT2 [Senna tora]